MRDPPSSDFGAAGPLEDGLLDWWSDGSLRIEEAEAEAEEELEMRRT